MIDFHKHKTKFFMCFVLFIGIVACLDKSKETPKAYPYQINLEEGLKNKTKLLLSEIADSVSYVVLGKFSEMPIRLIHNIEFDRNNIFISSLGENQSFLRFDNSGGLLNSVSKYGRGPQEYLSASFSVDWENKRITLLRNYTFDFLEYDFKGEYQKEFPFKFDETIQIFSYISKDRILLIPNYIEIPSKLKFDQKFLCELYDINGSLLKKIKHPIQYQSEIKYERPISTGGNRPSFYNQEAIISGYGLDTVYKISTDSIYKAFIFNRGKYAPDFMQRFSYTKQGESNSFLKDHGMLLETNGKAFSVFSIGGKGILFEYDKIEGRTRSMEFPYNLQFFSLKSTDFGFINDIDGGLNFYPMFTDRTGTMWLSYKDAFDFIKESNEKLKSTSHIVHKDYKTKLQKFVSSLNPEDNPVLIIVYLKK